jgi:O-antigen/teichoic acid export membrane protein
MARMTVLARKRSEARYHSRERVVLISLAVFAGIVIIAIGGSDKWLTAVGATLVPFAAVISVFRDRFRRWRFWSVLAALFAVHLALIWLVFGIILGRQDDIGLLVCVPFMLVESSVLYYSLRFMDRNRSMHEETPSESRFS